MFWITGILGLALGFSPFVLGFADLSAALWSNVVLGLIALVLSISGLATKVADKLWMYWVIILDGLAALVAPLVFDYVDRGAALWSGLIIGLLLVVLAAIKAFQSPEPLAPSQ